MLVCSCACAFACMWMHVRVCMYTWMCIHVCIFVFLWACVCLSHSMHLYVYMYKCVCMCVCCVHVLYVVCACVCDCAKFRYLPPIWLSSLSHNFWLWHHAAHIPFKHFQFPYQNQPSCISLDVSVFNIFSPTCSKTSRTVLILLSTACSLLHAQSPTLNHQWMNALCMCLCM